jgi:hypothetical protein
MDAGLLAVVLLLPTVGSVLLLLLCRLERWLDAEAVSLSFVAGDDLASRDTASSSRG